MADPTVPAPVPPEPAQPGLISRLVGVLVSPRATYPAVVARPRALGALVVTIALLATIQTTLLSTDVGKEMLMNQQVKTLESFGVNISDQMYNQMESRLAYAPYTAAAGQAITIPIICALLAAVLLGIFGMLLGGAGTFKQVFAIVAHSGIVLVVQALFASPLSYATGEFSSANLGVFLPMLEETGFLQRFLGNIDLFIVWWSINLAVGLSVLFKRKTGGIAAGLIGAYVFIVLILALVRSGS